MCLGHCVSKGPGVIVTGVSDGGGPAFPGHLEPLLLYPYLGLWSSLLPSGSSVVWRGGCWRSTSRVTTSPCRHPSFRRWSSSWAATLPASHCIVPPWSGSPRSEATRGWGGVASASTSEILQGLRFGSTARFTLSPGLCHNS